MTFSEFGRRIRSNTSFGTDHGAAAPLFFFGSNIEGGILGSNPVIPDVVTVRDNLPHEFEFRQLYSSIFQQWFCLARSRVDHLVGDFDTLDIIPENLRCSPTTSSAEISSSRIHVFPSPTFGPLHIQIKEKKGKVNIDIVSASGQVHRQFQADSSGTKITTDVSALPAGLYYVRLVHKEGISSVAFLKSK